MKPSEMPTCPTCGHALRFEQHKPHSEVSRLLCVEPRTLLDWIRAGAFGPRVVKVGRRFLIPLSAFHEFCRSRGVFEISGDEKAISARGEGELRRKANLRQFRSEVIA